MSPLTPNRTQGQCDDIPFSMLSSLRSLPWGIHRQCRLRYLLNPATFCTYHCQNGRDAPENLVSFNRLVKKFVISVALPYIPLGSLLILALFPQREVTQQRRDIKVLMHHNGVPEQCC